MAVWGASTGGGEATAGGNGVSTLAYPAQLPQDYYAKQLVAPVPAATASPPAVASAPPPAAVVPPPVTNNQNLGGTHYGPVPPDNPLYGWFWSNPQGLLFIYQEPGVWVQVGTGW